METEACITTARWPVVARTFSLILKHITVTMTLHTLFFYKIPKKTNACRAVLSAIQVFVCVCSGSGVWILLCFHGTSII